MSHCSKEQGMEGKLFTTKQQEFQQSHNLLKYFTKENENIFPQRFTKRF